MKKVLRIYIENSVIGGYFDKEFETSTKKLFELFRTGVYKPVISAHVIAELDKGAPDYVKKNLETIEYEKHVVNEEMKTLAKAYMAEQIVSDNYYDDALHIAIATILGVDVLVSFNFRHIVNLDRIKLFNAVNLKERYNMLEIRTPQEVLKNDD
ncbi:MAG: PIN domain protein [Candidatus Margulisbacteria bacterium]|jgi:hypothetical protein|nr:PIN domain protein [Candidatus Margulisiibacteriota bacterium]